MLRKFFLHDFRGSCGLSTFVYNHGANFGFGDELPFDEYLLFEDHGSCTLLEKPCFNVELISLESSPTVMNFDRRNNGPGFPLFKELKCDTFIREHFPTSNFEIVEVNRIVDVSIGIKLVASDFKCGAIDFRIHAFIVYSKLVPSIRLMGDKCRNQNKIPTNFHGMPLKSY